MITLFSLAFRAWVEHLISIFFKNTMKRSVFFFCFIILSLGITASGLAEQILHLIPAAEAPVIDGVASESVWQKAPVITTHDRVNNIPITLKGLYTAEEIFFLVRFPDPDESRSHKSWTWNKGREIYTVGHDREDIFVFKWNMEPQPVDLSIYSDDSYRADIWYWKACRTDRSGYADDKIHLLSPKQDRNATQVISGSGKTMYLLRSGDEGGSAYRVNLVSEFQGEIVPRFTIQQPTGSRSDVQAKGVWQNGEWTIEFRRKLVTGNQDDVQFTHGNKYLFGVSRYEIAGRKPNDKLSDPLYGTGDVNEILWIDFGD